MAKTPILVSYTETSWTTTGNRTTASISWQPYDVIVTIQGVENTTPATGTLGVPTGTGLSFTSIANNTDTGGNTCGSRLCVAFPTAAGSSTIQSTCGVAQNGLAVWVWRGASDVGTRTEQHTTTKTVSLTPRNGGTHSAICWAAFDFAAGAVGSLTPAPTTTRQAALSSTAYTYYVGELQNQPSGGAVSYGVTGTASAGVFSLLVAEIQGFGPMPNNFNRSGNVLRPAIFKPGIAR